MGSAHSGQMGRPRGATRRRKLFTRLDLRRGIQVCKVIYMRTEKLTAIKVENCEGDGDCSRCNRTGLIWVVTLSDGTRVGGECAKILLGWKPTKASHSWVTGMTVVAEKTVGARHIVLWVKGNRAAVAINGNLKTSGPVEWVTNEYAARYF